MFLISILISPAALLLGLKLPDIDLAPILWRHRSGWTHGPLLALVILFLDMRYPGFHYAWMALLFGIFGHLLRDAFPKGWYWRALINFKPLRVTLTPAQSKLWIFSSAMLAAFLMWMRL
jgi:membrane-bound metal-dependent hydrolase YbcI (DUF457 family)